VTNASSIASAGNAQVFPAHHEIRRSAAAQIELLLDFESRLLKELLQMLSVFFSPASCCDQ